jgi:hypothetical protein
LALVMGCAGRASSASTLPEARARDRSDGARVGTWVWRRETVLDANERHELLDLAQRKKITELYVAIADDYETPDGLAALGDLVRRAQESHIELFWVCGDPSWALVNRHARALSVVDRAIRINTLLQKESLPAIRGLQYDVEPYLLPEWKASPRSVEPQYASLLAKLRDATQRAGFELWLDVPFWFEERQFQDTSLGQLALRSSDGIVIMAYRNTAVGIVDKATDLLREPLARTRSVVVALETGCREEPATTLCGITAAGLDAAMAEIGGRLRSFDAFAGLAVHPYEGWRDLAPF